MKHNRLECEYRAAFKGYKYKIVKDRDSRSEGRQHK